MIRLVRLLWSLVGLLLILGGIPAALIWWRGWPLPTRLPTDEAGWQQWLDHPINASSIQNTAACLIWLLWALTAYLLAANLLARLRRTARRRPRFRLAAPLHTVASSLIGTVVLGLTSTTSRGVATTTDPALIPASGIADTTTPSLRPASATTEPSAQADRSADQQRGTNPTPATMVYEVRRGDRVWDIAERFLADAQRYPTSPHSTLGWPTSTAPGSPTTSSPATGYGSPPTRATAARVGTQPVPPASSSHRLAPTHHPTNPSRPHQRRRRRRHRPNPAPAKPGRQRRRPPARTARHGLPQRTPPHQRPPEPTHRRPRTTPTQTAGSASATAAGSPSR